MKLSFQALSARYGRKTILSDITTPDFHAGDVVAVIGPNATGKSTFFKRIFGLLPGNGQVVLEREQTERAAFSYMPQDISVNAILSVYESLLLACKQDRSWRVSGKELARIDESLRLMQIEHLANRKINELSGGQRQLVSLAQILTRQADILLLDEPTSALDLSHRHEILSFLKELAGKRDKIIFLAIHDLNDVLRYANKVMILANGSMTHCGAARDVLSSEVLETVFQVKARIEVCSKGYPHIMVDGPAKA